MYAKYKFEIVRGEDRSIPMSFFYRFPQSRKEECIELTGLDFLLIVRDWRTNEEIARLSTDDESIVLGNLAELDFVQTTDDEEATALLAIFTHDITEKFTGTRVVFELFAISRTEESETRQCLMIGEIKILKGVDYV